MKLSQNCGILDVITYSDLKNKVYWGYNLEFQMGVVVSQISAFCCIKANCESIQLAIQPPSYQQITGPFLMSSRI